MKGVETIRHSAILIGHGEDRIETYNSLDEVPAGLKRRLVESTLGRNSATLLIADQRGRVHLAETMKQQRADNDAAASLTSADFMAPPTVTSTRFPWTDAIRRRESREMSKRDHASVSPTVSGRVVEGVELKTIESSLRCRFDRAWLGEHWAELMVPVAVAGALWFLLTAF